MHLSKRRFQVLPVILAIGCTGLVTGAVSGSQDPKAIPAKIQEERVVETRPVAANAKPVRTPTRAERYEKKIVAQIAGVMENFDTRLTEAEEKMLPQWIFNESRKHGYDPLFLTGLIITESTFNNRAKSPAGALGLMQIRPRTGRSLAKELDIPWHGPETLYDPQVNLALGAYYLKKQLHRFGDLSLALEAYNHGPTRLSQYLEKGRQPRLYSSRVFDFYSEIRFQKPGPRLIFASFPQEGDDISYWMPDMEFEAQSQPEIAEADIAPPSGAGKKEESNGRAVKAAKEAEPEKFYGPVQRGETLLKVVYNLGYKREDAHRAVVALWLANRDRFLRQNLNGLRTGVMLRLGGVDQKAKRLSAVVAERVLKTQWAEWKGDIPQGQPIVITEFAELELKKPEFIPTPMPANPSPQVAKAPTQKTIQSGDTLLTIAENLGYSKQETPRVVVALWKDNREKFIDGNLHGLRIGETLDLVNLDERKKELDVKSAHRIIQGQWQKWVARES